MLDLADGAAHGQMSPMELGNALVLQFAVALVAQG